MKYPPFVAVTAVIFSTFASAADKLNRFNVAALDSQGQAVTGLQSSDFQLLLDGKPQTISFFRFTGDKPTRAMKPDPGLDAHEYSNRAGVPLHATVVLIDLLSDRLMTGSVIAEEIIRAFKNLESDEGLYLYILTSSGALYPVHPLPNPDSEAVAGVEPWTRNIAAMLQTAIKTVFGFRPVDDRDIAVRFDLTVKALRELGGQMRLISGRKSLVWVTHGVPLAGPSISEQGIVDFTNRLRSFSEELERVQIVVYPVAESSRGAAATSGTESEMALEEIASVTGGRFYRSGAVSDALRQSTMDARANYQLGYYSEPIKPDGKHHKVRVVCAHKEVRLQTEPGFYAMLPQEQPGAVEHNAGILAAHSPFDATDIGLRAKVSPDPDREKNMRFEIHIDAGDLLLRQAGDHRTGRISLLFAVYGPGGMGQSEPIPIDLNLTPAQYESGIVLHQSVPTGANVRKVRVIVVDRDLGASGSVTMPIQR